MQRHDASGRARAPLCAAVAAAAAGGLILQLGRGASGTRLREEDGRRVPSACQCHSLSVPSLAGCRRRHAQHSLRPSPKLKRGLGRASWLACVLRPGDRVCRRRAQRARGRPRRAGSKTAPRAWRASTRTSSDSSPSAARSPRPRKNAAWRRHHRRRRRRRRAQRLQRHQGPQRRRHSPRCPTGAPPPSAIGRCARCWRCQHPHACH